MSKPILEKVNFPKLSKSPNKPNNGTVTGKHMKEGDDVTIVSKDSGILWMGDIKSNLSGNTWNAVVFRVPLEDKGTETVGVTVTNAEGSSNEVTQKSDVVP